ncbi:MAG: hypothetical protein IOD12_14690 [Silvanigrellales bacterium]|nr:hypothetical protein [Silvanigrellales bacterium]
MDNLVGAFEACLRVEFERQTDLSFAETFRSHCQVEGAETTDYLNQEIACPSGVRLLVGIRFRNLNLARPFVSVLAQDQAHLSQEDVGWLVSALPKRFPLFAPRSLRLFTHVSDPNWNKHLPLTAAGKMLVAAPLAEVLEAAERVKVKKESDTAEGVQRSDGLELRRAKDTAFYATYVEAYEHAYKDFPPCREWARIETEEDLTEMISEGCLFEVFQGGRWAGVIGGTLGESFGLSGLHIEEILLARWARGRGLGRRVQQEVAKALVTQEGLASEQWLSGSLGRMNTPALRTALSAGRRILGAEFWLPLEGT